MKYTEAGLGRIFILRLEDGETGRPDLDAIGLTRTI